MIAITIEAMPQLHDPYLEGKIRLGFDEENDRISQRVAMAIAGSSVASRGVNVPILPTEESGSRVSIIFSFVLNSIE